MKRNLNPPKALKHTKISDFFPRIEKNCGTSKQRPNFLTSPTFDHKNKRHCLETQTVKVEKEQTGEEVEYIDISQYLSVEIKEEPGDVADVCVLRHTENMENVKSFVTVEILDDDSPVKPTLKETPTKTETSKTPTKITPRKKLFHKSPKHLDEFNVQVIENFIRITPSKSSSGSSTNKSESPGSGSKSQRSILTSISPFQKSLGARNANETTPSKVASPNKGKLTPQNQKVKVKLDFGSPKVPKSIKCEDTVDVNAIFEDSWDNSNWNSVLTEEYTLNLNQSQHCKVLELRTAPNKCTLIIESTVTREKALCNLEGFWTHSKVKVGDTLHITAVKDASSEWSVNNDHGLLVYEPDLLVSGTTVVGSLFCKRRSVLSEQYKEAGKDNSSMVVGVLVHHLLQSALQSKLSGDTILEKILENLLKSPDTIRLLYSSSLSLTEIETELRQFLPQISVFIEQYIQGKSLPTKPDNWKGKIDSIEDIEENFWCPELGVKGKVDVSVRISNGVVPLELKTGRASVSLEHRAQVMLYILMMSKFGYKVNTGLLLYLREGVLREIPLTHKEHRDIMMMRNELVYYLAKESCLRFSDKGEGSLKSVGDLLKASELNVCLPEPINHRACSNCSYNTVCAAYLNLEKYDLSNNKALKEVQEQVFRSLKKSHLDYFFEWTLMLSMENQASKKDRKEVREIFTIKPELRERDGKCIAYTNILKTEESNGTYLVTFKKVNQCPEDNFLRTQIGENNYVVISTEKRPAVAFGFVTTVEYNAITITVDRDLNAKYSSGIFHIDQYDSNNTHLFNMTNLSLILEPTKNAQRLRTYIIDKQTPTFRAKLPRVVASVAAPILKRLNRAQQRAVLRALSANDYILIKGMPGTGKTSTIVALTQLLLKLEQTVLITSHTHSAVDNVCVRLRKFGVEVLRLGSSARIHADLASSSEHELTKFCTTPEELEIVYHSAKVVAVTCLGSGHPVLTKRTFDICIVDESTQVLQPTIFRSLLAAKKFVLIGDPDQLPPIVRNKSALDRGMSVSLFERLQSSESTVALNLNYRMNEPITELANKLTYNGELLVANEEVAKSHLKLPKLKDIIAPLDDWVKKTLDTTLNASIKFVDIGQSWKYNFAKDEMLCSNKCETAIVAILAKLLIKAGQPSNTIGIISPYRAQVADITTSLHDLNVDINTVDQFQGQDKDVIIFSCTKSFDLAEKQAPAKFEILEDRRRLNVALTRAKRKLIIVGDASTVKIYSPVGKLLQCLAPESFVIACKDQKSFDDVVALLNLL